MQAAMILLMTENAAAGSCYAHDLLLHLFRPSGLVSTKINS